MIEQKLSQIGLIFKEQKSRREVYTQSQLQSRALECVKRVVRGGVSTDSSDLPTLRADKIQFGHFQSESSRVWRKKKPRNQLSWTKKENIQDCFFFFYEFFFYIRIGTFS